MTISIQQPNQMADQLILTSHEETMNWNSAEVRFGLITANPNDRAI